jgi:two-component system chemotaxis response regulator CheY
VEGIDLLRHFRTQPQFSRTAFIMLTAASEQGEVLQAIKAGATAYLVKPVSKATVSKKFLETVEWLKKTNKK